MEYAFSLMDYKRHTIFEKKKLSRERKKNLINTILIIVYIFLSIREKDRVATLCIQKRGEYRVINDSTDLS